LRWELNEAGMEALGVSAEEFVLDIRNLAFELYNAGEKGKALTAMRFAEDIEKDIKAANNELVKMQEYWELVEAGFVEPIELQVIIEKVKEYIMHMRAIGEIQEALKAHKWLNELNRQYEDNIKKIKEQTLAFQAQKVLIDTYNQSVDRLSYAFSERLVNSIINSKDAVADWGDIFQQIITQIIAELIALSVKMAVIWAIKKAIGVAILGPAGILVAKGINATVRQPTLFMAGESGPEKVRVTPNSRVNSNRSEEGGQLVVNINGDVYGKEKFMRGVNEALHSINRRYVSV
jgi:hypothetical protein